MSKKASPAQEGQASLFAPPPPAESGGDEKRKGKPRKPRKEKKKPALELRPVVDSEMDADAAWLRASVEAFEPRLRELESRGDEAEGPAGPPAWEKRLDLGCGWGCHCCESPLGDRPFLDLDRWTGWRGRLAHPLTGSGERRLAERLETAVHRSEPIVIGAATDPYAGDAEGRARTHRLLKAIAELDGAEVALTTASPLVLVDLDLLVEIDRDSSLSVELVAPTGDPGLARRLEPGAPGPAERVSALREIAAQGIVTRLRLAPLLPGLTDGQASLRPLVEAAATAGVTDVAASPLTMPSPFDVGRRRTFLDWLHREEPELAAQYRRLYRFRRTLRPADRRAAVAAFELLRLEHGFPRATASRG